MGPFTVALTWEISSRSPSMTRLRWPDSGLDKRQSRGLKTACCMPGLYPGNYGRATGINNLGGVVGVSGSSGGGDIAISGYYRPFQWDSVAGLSALTINKTGAALETGGASSRNSARQALGPSRSKTVFQSVRAPLIQGHRNGRRQSAR